MVRHAGPPRRRFEEHPFGALRLTPSARRLWPSGYRLGDADKPLWIGSVSDQTKLTPLGLLAIPATSNRFTDAYRVLLQDLGPARPQQPDPGRNLILLGP